MKIDILHGTAALISKEFQLAPEELGNPNEKTILRARVAHVIQHFIDNNLEGLLNILYIMDVDENLIKAALMDDSEEPVNLRIADIVIEREMQKVMSRIKYKQDPIDDVDKW